MNNLESYTEWTHISSSEAYRTWQGRIFQKTFNKAYYAGHQIKHIHLDSPIGREWLQKVSTKQYI
jgi:hypothetical protein